MSPLISKGARHTLINKNNMAIRPALKDSISSETFPLMTIATKAMVSVITKTKILTYSLLSA